MKILQLTCHFSPNVGGVETHLDDLVNGLVEKNNDVFVLTYRPLTTKTSWKTYESKRNLQIFRIPWLSGFFYEFVNNPAFEFMYLFPALFIVTPFVLISKNFDVIHAHGLIAGIAGVIWSKIFKKKIIVSTHSIYHFPKKGMYKNISKWLFSNANEVLCLSSQSREEIINLGVNGKKVKVFTYWVDQRRFHKISNAKKELKFGKKFVVLFVGRLVKEKGVLELLEAASKWDKKITLIIAGTGPLEEEVKAKSNKENIFYAGKIYQNNLPIYYSASNVLIVPSIHEEGFGRVILEALSCGTPVIAANRGGIVEAINQDVGYLIDITSENIKKTVEYCYDHRLELENKSKKAQMLAKEKYSGRNIEIIISAYK